MRYETREEILAKVDWEGGLEESLRYGLKTEDMPLGDDELRDAWDEAQEAFREYDVLSRRVMRLLEGE